MTQRPIARLGRVALATAALAVFSACGDATDLETIGSDDTQPLAAAPGGPHREHPKPAHDCTVPGAVTFVSEPIQGSLPTGLERGGHALWFTDYERTAIARVALHGAISWFEPVVLPQGEMSSVAVGPNGDIWFNGGRGDLTHFVGRMTPLGDVALFDLPSEERAGHLATGGDGNVWFTTAHGYLGRVTPSGELTFIEVPFGRPHDLTAGPAQSIWFTLPDENRIGRLSRHGVFKSFEVPTAESGLQAITTGPDGSVWFSETRAKRIGRIAPSGRIQEFEVRGDFVKPDGDLAVGSDGAVWFGQISSRDVPSERVNRMARLTPSGQLTELPLPPVLDPEGHLQSPVPIGVAFGADGNLWSTAALGLDSYVSVVLRVTPSRCRKRW